jgi:hypothetical protein
MKKEFKELCSYVKMEMTDYRPFPIKVFVKTLHIAGRVLTIERYSTGDGVSNLVYQGHQWLCKDLRPGEGWLDLDKSPIVHIPRLDGQEEVWRG